MRPVEAATSAWAAVITAGDVSVNVLGCQSFGSMRQSSRGAGRYDLSVNRAAWIDAFVMHLSRLGSRASPEELCDMAAAYFVTHGRSDPVKVAQWRVDEIGLFHG